MRALRPIALLVIADVLVAGRSGAEAPAASRLEGRLPDNVPVVSIDQTRGTVLDALSAISKQAGWSLVVTAPESVTSRVLTIQVRKRPSNEALDLILEAGIPVFESRTGNVASEARGHGTGGEWSLHVRGVSTTMNRPRVIGIGLSWQ